MSSIKHTVAIHSLTALVGQGGVSSVTAHVTVKSKELRGDTEKLFSLLPLPPDLDLATLSSPDAEWLSVRLIHRDMVGMLSDSYGSVSADGGKSTLGPPGKLFYQPELGTLFVVELTALNQYTGSVGAYSWPSDRYTIQTMPRDLDSHLRPRLAFQRLRLTKEKATGFSLNYSLTSAVSASTLYEMHLHVGEITHVKQSFVLHNTGKQAFDNVRELVVRELPQPQQPPMEMSRSMAQSSRSSDAVPSSASTSSGGLLREFRLPGKFHLAPESKIRVSGPTLEFPQRIEGGNRARLEYWSLPNQGPNPQPWAVLPMQAIPSGSILFDGTAVLHVHAAGGGPAQILEGGRFAYTEKPSKDEARRADHIVVFNPLASVSVGVVPLSVSSDSAGQSSTSTYRIDAENRTNTAINLKLVVVVNVANIKISVDETRVRVDPYVPYGKQRVRNLWRVLSFSVDAQKQFASEYSTTSVF